MNVFAVESPMQLLSAISIKNEYKLTNCVLCFLKTKSEQNNMQVTKLIDAHPWEEVRVVDRGSYRLFQYLNLLAFIILQNVNNVYIGDYRSFFLRILVTCSRAKRKFVIDDGIAVWSIVDKYILNNRNYVGLYKGGRLFVAKVLAILLPNTSFRVMTSLPLEGTRVDKYVYDFSNITLQGGKNFSDAIIMVGSPFIECGILTEDKYCEYLSEIYERESKSNSKVYYFMHRRESKRSIELIREVGLEIVSIDVPIELYLIGSQGVAKLISFNSAVLYNVASFDFNIPTFYYRIPQHDIVQTERKSMEEAYELISKASELYNEK